MSNYLQSILFTHQMSEWFWLIPHDERQRRDNQDIECVMEWILKSSSEVRINSSRFRFKPNIQYILLWLQSPR